MAVSIRKRSSPELVQADCQTADEIGDIVKISADAVGGIYQVEKLDVTSDPSELIFGLIISKATSTRCFVRVGGRVEGLYTGLTPGKMLYVGMDSKLTHSVPTRPPVGVKSIYHAALALSNDTLLLNFQPPIRFVA